MLNLFNAYSGQNFPLVIRLIVLFSCFLFSILLWFLWSRKTKPFVKRKNQKLGKESTLYKTLNLINIICILLFPLVGLIFVFI